MTDQQKSMRVKEFVALLKEADRVVRAGDYARFDEIDARLKGIGYGLQWRDGSVYIVNLRQVLDDAAKG